MALEFRDCPNPWTLMLLYPEMGGCASPCCHLAPNNKLLYQFKENIIDIWNSELFSGLRKHIADDNPVFPQCINCHTRKIRETYPHTPPQESLSVNFSQFQRENTIAAQNSYSKREVAVSHLPLYYIIRFGLECNIRCIMCNHHDAQVQDDVKQFPVDWLKRQKSFLKSALCIQLHGGEPLFMKNSCEFFDYLLDDPDFSQVEISIATNGLYLDRFIHKMKDHFVRLQISIDAVGERYNKIRKGSSWQKVSSNIDAFLKMRESAGTSLPTPSIWCVITKTGLPVLPDLVFWCKERGLNICFDMMETRAGLNGRKIAPEESLWEIPALLLDMPKWENYFDYAVNILEKFGCSGEARQLANLKLLLKRNARAQLAKSLNEYVSDSVNYSRSLNEEAARLSAPKGSDK